jgi:hypothetical protein
MGLYQLFFLDRVPNHAACHETVQLAKRVGLSTSSSFINAILRSEILNLEPCGLLLQVLCAGRGREVITTRSIQTSKLSNPEMKTHAFGGYEREEA